MKRQTDREILELVRKLRADPFAAAVAQELSELSAQAGKEDSPKRFTYNKLWWLLQSDL